MPIFNPFMPVTCPTSMATSFEVRDRTSAGRVPSCLIPKYHLGVSAVGPGAVAILSPVRSPATAKIGQNQNGPDEPAHRMRLVRWTPSGKRAGQRVESDL